MDDGQMNFNDYEEKKQRKARETFHRKTSRKEGEGASVKLGLEVTSILERCCEMTNTCKAQFVTMCIEKQSKEVVKEIILSQKTKEELFELWWSQVNDMEVDV